jgi:sporulation protein YlmC with PRC-barrel domain
VNVLQKLNTSDLHLSNFAQDIRGAHVIDPNGATIGAISDLYIDERDRDIRMLEISAGGALGFGHRWYLLPADAIVRVGAGDVHVNQTLERVTPSPAYNPNRLSRPAREYWEPFYGYYGFPPYWSTDTAQVKT